MAGGMRAFLLFVISAIHCASAIAEQRTEEYEFDIPRSPIGSAITQIAQQTTGFSIGFLPRPDEKDVLVGPLQGRFTIADALTKLFSGTDFDWELLGPGNVHVFRRTQERRNSRQAERVMSPMESHARQTRPQSGTIVVLASRMNVDAGLLPSTTLHTETIESYGVSTLGELLRQLPQIPFVRGPETRVSGEQYADLRGFGAGTTLVLINGRRVGATGTSFDTSAFDVNTVPLAAVKQVEILPDSHLEVGADAIGGIINIVLKDDITEPVVQLSYGAAAGGAQEGRASIGFGISRERFRGTATLEAFQREFLFGNQRDLTRNQDFRRFGRRDMRSADAMPPNISSLTGANLPGLASSFAAVPTGLESPTISDFAATAGHRNLDSANRYRSIIPKSNKIGAVATAEYSPLNSVSVFGELFAVERENQLEIGPPAVRGAVIPATNPFNPFGEPVVVNALVDGIGPTTWVTDASLLRGVLGAVATFSDWTAQASATWHGEDASMFQENHFDSAKLTQALAATDPDRALNFFRDGPPGSLELLRSLRADRGNDSFDSYYLGGHFSAHGPMFTLGAGAVQLLLGGEWREEGLSTPALSERQRSSSAAFGELRLPIVAPHMEIAGAEVIDVALGVRRDHDDFGTHMTDHYAVSWVPVQQVEIVVSYRDFFRSPNLNDLYLSPISGGPFQLPDPRRNYEVGSLMAVFGGNLSLMPNSGRSWTASLEYKHSEQLSLSASYWNAVIRDRITYLTTIFTLNNEAQFPGRVIRSAPTPQDIELGFPGRLQALDVSPGNYGTLKAAGMDFSMKGSWHTRYGRLSPTVSATWNRTFTTATAGLHSEQRVGIGSHEGTIPRWRALANVRFERGMWSLFSAVRFTSSYDDALLGIKNGRTVGTSLQFDAQAAMQLDKLTPRAALQGVKLTAGAINLFDADAEYSEVFGSEGYDWAQADMRQRFWYVGVEKTF